MRPILIPAVLAPSLFGHLSFNLVGAPSERGFNLAFEGSGALYVLEWSYWPDEEGARTSCVLKFSDPSWGVSQVKAHGLFR